MYKTTIKPLLDFLAALLGLLVLSPVFVVAWIGLALANNGKPFFYQHRPGKDKPIFTVL